MKNETIDNEEEIWEEPIEEPEEEERGEAISNRETLVSEIFETKERLEKLKHRWRGDIEINGHWIHKFDPMASDKFINKEISNAESIIDTINSFTKKDATECKRILKDAVDAFILDCVNDESVDVRDIRTMSKSFEHSLELFLGLVEFGHGSKVLTNSLAGLNFKDPEQGQKKGGVAEWIKGKLS